MKAATSVESRVNGTSASASWGGYRYAPEMPSGELSLTTYGDPASSNASAAGTYASRKSSASSGEPAAITSVAKKVAPRASEAPIVRVRQIPRDIRLDVNSVSALRI